MKAEAPALGRQPIRGQCPVLGRGVRKRSWTRCSVSRQDVTAESMAAWQVPPPAGDADLGRSRHPRGVVGAHAAGTRHGLGVRAASGTFQAEKAGRRLRWTENKKGFPGNEGPQGTWTERCGTAEDTWGLRAWLEGPRSSWLPRTPRPPGVTLLPAALPRAQPRPLAICPRREPPHVWTRMSWKEGLCAGSPAPSLGPLGGRGVSGEKRQVSRTGVRWPRHLPAQDTSPGPLPVPATLLLPARKGGPLSCEQRD